MINPALTGFCLLVLCCLPFPTRAQDTVKPPYMSKFVNVGDVRIHYLDFGGEGLPILLVPTGDRTALHYKDFGPRFVDRHRVLAITPRGTGQSGGKLEPHPAARVRDILALLDTLAIPRAVIVGNTGPAVDMTYLAEHHADRLAGLVYLNNAPDYPPPDSLDRSGGLAMYKRYIAAVLKLSPDVLREMDSYRPEYLQRSAARLTVPALTFVNKDGKTRGLESFNILLAVGEQVRREGGGFIPDSIARSYFERLARDSALQVQVRASWDDVIAPMSRANQAKFYRAFGEHLQIVSLDVPFVSGYEYNTAPDLIYPHIRRFLEKIRQAR